MLMIQETGGYPYLFSASSGFPFRFVILAEGKNQVKRITLFCTYYSNTSCLL